MEYLAHFASKFLIDSALNTVCARTESAQSIQAIPLRSISSNKIQSFGNKFCSVVRLKQNWRVWNEKQSEKVYELPLYLEVIGLYFFKNYDGENVGDAIVPW